MTRKTMWHAVVQNTQGVIVWDYTGPHEPFWHTTEHTNTFATLTVNVAETGERFVATAPVTFRRWRTEIV